MVEQVVLSEFAHTGDLYYLQRDATRHLLTTFFEKGEIDTSLFQPHAVNFKPRWGFPLIAKLVLAGAVLTPVISVLLLWLSIRLVRRLVRRHRV